MIKKPLLTTLLTVLATSPVMADQYLIDEMESLKATLNKTDPDRAELSLRLADLYFDISIQEGESKDLIPKREKALKLYKDVLEGRDGIPKASAAKAVVIRFQMARVLNKLGRIDEAKDFYVSVYNDNLVSKKIKRESAFSLAEYYEEKVVFLKADDFYVKALALCETKESKNYGHYKRAWLHYKEVKLDSAISELKLSLFEKDGSVREKVINDLLLFFSARTTNGEPELAYIKQLAKKTGKKDLVRRLVEAFYAAGNRIAGSTVLVHLNNEKPDPFYEMRLLEEFYGFRDIDLVKEYLARLEKRNLFDTPQDKEEAKEFKAMLRRVIVQFDSEVQTNKSYESILKRAIDQYLVFFPQDELKKKMQQGWLKVVSDPKEKIAKLHLWINEDISFNVDAEHIRKMRQTRLALAQKAKMSDVVLSESQSIAKMLANSDEAREFQYITAHEYYQRKRYTQAKSIFVGLASLQDKTEIDKWAILSQNLLLDIYNIEKKYDDIVAQANGWLNNPLFITNKKLSKEVAEMQKVRKQASFEAVTLLGETKIALNKFYAFCFEKVFEQKSCDNAKVLAIKLKDQEKLIALLEKSKDEQSLMVEYELMGRFTDAAKLQEKYLLNRNAEITTYLKIAMLYEIDEEFAQRDRILGKLISKLRKQKNINAQYETAIYKTFEQANLLNNRVLLLPWSTGNKIKIAQYLSVIQPTKLSKKIINSQKEYAGSAWAKSVLNKVQKLYAKQAKLGFYGRYSQSKFKRKVKAIEKMAKLGKTYLEGANTETRVYILDMLAKAYQKFGQDILNTPMPEGLTEDISLQVQAKLTQMASPYLTVADDYLRLQHSEVSKLEVLEKTQIENKLATNFNHYADLIEEDTFSIQLSQQIDYAPVRKQKEILLKDPMNLTALNTLEQYFKEQKNSRLAAYFTGRINSLKEKNL